MRAVVAGAGPIGLASAILLARDGWEVRVYEKDPQEPPGFPDALWSSWERPGVAQFRMPHFMMPKFRHLLDAELPAVRDRLEQLGARRFNLVETLPPSLPDRSLRPEDARFETLTARRPIVEAAFAQVAAETPGVEIMRGVGVEGPLEGSTRGGDTSIPHVVGMLTTTGERVPADLVVDALGRRSPLPQWVADLGGRPPFEEASDAGFAYYARHFRSRHGAVPEYRGPIGGPVGTLLALTIVGDNACWTVALAPTAGDAPLKALRRVDTWDKVAHSIPHVAPWLDGEPLGGVLPMAGVLDRYRRLVVEGRPVVTGIAAIGDSWACTNPTAGRGISLGLAQAIALRDVARESGDNLLQLALRLDEATESALTPWYRDQVDRDRQRAAMLSALVEGRPPENGAHPGAERQMAFLAAAAHDAEVARAALETFACLALPSEVMSRPGLSERVMRYLGAPVPQLPAPSRAELLSLVSGATT